MRRIYDSHALKRDDDDSFAPRERRGDDATPAAMRSVPGETLSRLLVPEWLRDRALSVAVETPRDTYQSGTDVPVRVTLKNAFPIPITVRTPTPRLWTWDVDGHPEASKVPADLPEEERVFSFDRGERKRFTRRWSQSFKVSETEWEPVGPGEYAIGASLSVPDAAEKGLAAETTVRIEEP
ncbi:hypothetical protein KTS45_12260 [Halomicroarcula limicola]|uniref:DUF7974 domain-containing protein n=1 Tax=Haloarcula limicola TaxID=1429915 RepID=A0A8J8C3X8_9EURY|nr:hypothetical protein [Halomicroarcula limicola]MBV0924971.1 hypothetical protein [Halomicroarcula limicola]